MLALSEHLGQDVLAADGRPLGRLADLAVRLDELHPPVVLALVRRRRGELAAYAWEDVASFERSAVGLREGARELGGAGPEDVLLARDVLDVQVLAIGGRRLDRVGDVELARDGALLRLTGVEVGLVPLLRRLGLRRLASGRPVRRVDWADARIASGHAHALEIGTSHPERPIGGMEVAQLVAHLPARRAVELLQRTDRRRAASALASLRPRLGGRLVDALGAEAGAIVAAMPLDDATAALRHVDRARLDGLLASVPGERAAELRRLLGYPAGRAGGLMTSEILVAPATAPLAELRGSSPRRGRGWRRWQPCCWSTRRARWSACCRPRRSSPARPPRSACRPCARTRRSSGSWTSSRCTTSSSSRSSTRRAGRSGRSRSTTCSRSSSSSGSRPAPPRARAGPVAACARVGSRGWSRSRASSAPASSRGSPTTTRRGSPPTRSWARSGYRLLWVLLASTVALVLFHELGARMGVATGQGLMGLVRERFGVRVALGALAALVAANVGTTCAELAGVAAAADLAGVPRWVAVPVAALAVAALVVRGGFRRVERVLLVLSAVFATYVVAGLLAGPDWAAAGLGLVVPSLPLDRDGILLVTATIGTTLAPWGLSFVQSYVVDKRLTPRDLRYERVDVVVGAAMTGVIGAFVVVACAATLHAAGRGIDDARDAASALEPLAGGIASTLFGVGLLGAALLATAILPLSTAYSVCEALGAEGAVDDRPRDAPVFYGAYALVLATGVAVVLVPGVPVVGVLYLTQALNAVLLLPLLVLVRRVARDRSVMGELALGRAGAGASAAAIVVLGACVAALLALSVAG
ncbi:MAG: divalent metal cation transporter [Thermoleophilia bacterium]